jgi:RNA-directed DNA polymerase
LGDLTTTDIVQELQRKLYLKAKSNTNFRFYALYDKVYRTDVLKKAWSNVRANKGSSGIDGQTIKDIEQEGVDNFLKVVGQELRTKIYQPQAARRVFIPKPDGTKRPLSIPTLKDRVVQASLKLIIEPIFEADFENCSYGFRPSRSAQQAAEEVRKYLNFGYKEVIETDIENCFGSIPHRELLDMIAKRIVDGEILRLIKLFLKAGVMEDNEVHKDDKGTPQGGVISPLLANIYLNSIDKGWKSVSKTARLIRYADDLVIITKYKAEGYKMKLEGMVSRIKLTLKAKKTRIVDVNQQSFDFLGYTFMRVVSHKSNKTITYCFPSSKAVTAIKRRIREITDCRRPVKVEQIVKELEPVSRGWVNYFRMFSSSKKFGAVREYTAQRVRRFMRRRRQRAGYGYKEYSHAYLYQKLGLYNNYSVCRTKAY